MRRSGVAAFVAALTFTATGLVAAVAPTAGATTLVTSDPPIATIRLDHPADLLDGQTVHVRGAGFLRGETVAFATCAGICNDFRTVPHATADQRGRIDARVPVSRYASEYMDRYPIDCAYTACTFEAIRLDGIFEDGYLDRAATSVGFRPGDHLGVPVTVWPRSGLHDGDTVAVLVSGLGPAGGFTIRQCTEEVRGGHPAETCGRGDGGTADATGRALLPFTIAAPDGSDPCGTGPTVCSLRIADSQGRFTTLLVGVTSPAGPPPPTLTLDPVSPATDHATITASGAGYAPGAAVAVAECDTAEGWDRCGPPTSVTAGPDGRFTTNVTVERYLNRAMTGLLDCAISPCLVRAVAGAWWDRGGSAPLTFHTDPVAPHLSLRGAVVAEGTGAGVARPRASLDHVTDHPVTFSWNAYLLGETGTASIPAGSDSVDLAVPYTGNTVDDDHRASPLFLTAIDGAEPDAVASRTQVWILDDDAPTARVDVMPGIASEHDRAVNLEVRLTGATNRFVEVAYRLRGRTAVAGTDFVDRTGVVSILPGDDSGTISVPLVDDATPESGERFVVEITEVRRAVAGTTRASAWILDDD